MNKENSKDKNNPLMPKTPLEYIGFGFMLMVIISGLFVIADHGTLEDFSSGIWGVYAFLTGPFILHGAIGIWHGLSVSDTILKKGSLNNAAIAHYVSLWARGRKEMDVFNCILVFAGVYIATMVISHIWKKLKSK